MSSSKKSIGLSASSVASGDGYNDVLSSILHLSDELEYFGLHPLPQLTNEEGCAVLPTRVTSLVTSLVDTAWHLLQVHRSSVQQCEGSETKWSRVADDNKNLQAQVDRLKANLSNKEQLLSAASNKEQRLTAECNKLRIDLRNAKDKVQRLATQVTRRDCQHAHTLRKKEHEMARIQEQLRRSLGLSSTATRHVTDHAACERCGGSTSHTSSDSDGVSAVTKEKEELHREVISEYESNSQTLVQLNIRLRDMYCKLRTDLGFLTQQLAALAEKYFGCGEYEQKSEDGTSDLQMLPSAVLEMPHNGTGEYEEEWHLISNRHCATMQALLHKLSSNLELLQHSSRCGEP